MRTPSWFTVPSLLLFTACSGGELVGVHIDLAADGSGTLTLRSLAPADSATAAETRTHGADWTVRGALVSSQGTFSRIAQVTLGDGEVTFAPQLDGDRPGLRVTLTRGPDAKWIAALTPPRQQRRRLAGAYDPTGRTREIGDVLRLEIAAPGRVITSGVLPTGRGVEANRDGDKATLLLPVATAREEGDAFVWDISWLRK
ncbi:MAG TPA: hypothetical protein ENI87_14890 [bacterium]|nr:hypothetical protein [bacterium]